MIGQMNQGWLQGNHKILTANRWFVEFAWRNRILRKGCQPVVLSQLAKEGFCTLSPIWGTMTQPHTR